MNIDTKKLSRIVASSTGCSWEDAEDAVMDAIVRVLERGVKDTDNTDGLIWRIATRLIYRNRHRPRITPPNRPESTESVLMPDLTPRQREVVELRLEGYTDAEIGERLHISRQAVGRIRKRIQKKWN